MFYSNNLLLKFSKLSERILDQKKSQANFSEDSLEKFPFEAGQRISRGFADLGFEEFVILNGRKILSLYTGKVSEIPEGHEKFFFAIYDVEDFTKLAIFNGWDLISSNYIDQRKWHLIAEFRANKARVLESIAPSLIEALLDLNLKIYEK